MPDVAINQDAIVGVSFFNDSGAVAGVGDMAVAVINRATGTSIATGTATESPSGSGYYTYTINSSLISSPMRLLITFTSAASELYDEVFVRVRNIPSYALTRRELRQAIARLLDGQDAVHDSEATGGTTTTAVLPYLVYGGGDEFRGMWARFTDGNNRAQTRRITEFDEETFTITFAPALSSAVASGDRVEMYMLDPRIIDQAVLDAYAQVAEIALVPFTDRVITTDGTSLEFTLPSDAVKITRVGVAQGTTFYGWLSPNDWELRSPQKIAITYGRSGYDQDLDPLRITWNTGANLPWPAGWTIWLEGLASIEPPLYDDSFVDVAPGFVRAFAHWQLAQHRPQMANVWPFLKRTADEERRALSRSRNNTRSVR